MTLEAFETAVNAFLARRPFQPFLVDLVNGRRLEVDHRQALAYRGGATAVFIAPGGIPIFLDHEGVVSFTASTADQAP